MGYASRAFLFIWFITTTIAYAQPHINETETEIFIKQLETNLAFSDKETQTGASRELFAESKLKIYPNAFDKNSSLLLYLKEPANEVYLSVIDTMGNIKDVPLSRAFASGFYEISVMPNSTSKGIFTIKLIVDGKIYYQQIVR